MLCCMLVVHGPRLSRLCSRLVLPSESRGRLACTVFVILVPSPKVCTEVVTAVAEYGAPVIVLSSRLSATRLSSCVASCAQRVAPASATSGSERDTNVLRFLCILLPSFFEI